MTAAVFQPTASPPLSCTPKDGHLPIPPPTLLSSAPPVAGAEEEGSTVEGRGGDEQEGDHQLSLLGLLLTVFRRSIVACAAEKGDRLRSMEIGWPTEVRHVAHVTFDRFHGFLGLPDEFEPEVPRRAPSASATVFGVSTESMQCSYDARGNSVPTILLMMQRHLYAQGGLQAEGIFRITAENSHEELVRDQLNRGKVPDDIDVHCLAGLIKAWFRELPDGVLDSLTPEQVMECQTEDDHVQLVKLLPSTESALLDWAVNLMADVVQEEHHNKMNEHNIATVFAPNMTQMSDPLTALMHAVQVMNFLKTLIQKALRERQGSALNCASASPSGPPDRNDTLSSSHICKEAKSKEESEEPVLEKPIHPSEDCSSAYDATDSSQASHRMTVSDGSEGSTDDQQCKFQTISAWGSQPVLTLPKSRVRKGSRGKKSSPPTLTLDLNKLPKKPNAQSALRFPSPVEKSKEISTLSRISSRVERVEAWR